ncbi:MAG TPA: hypothetical protein VGO87_00665, partial [Acidimicrobiia bacterium]
MVVAFGGLVAVEEDVEVVAVVDAGATVALVFPPCAACPDCAEQAPVTATMNAAAAAVVLQRVGAVRIISSIGRNRCELKRPRSHLAAGNGRIAAAV